MIGELGSETTTGELGVGAATGASAEPRTWIGGLGNETTTGEPGTIVGDLGEPDIILGELAATRTGEEGAGDLEATIGTEADITSTH